MKLPVDVKNNLFDTDAGIFQTDRVLIDLDNVSHVDIQKFNDACNSIVVYSGGLGNILCTNEAELFIAKYAEYKAIHRFRRLDMIVNNTTKKFY